ncbi:unnamed protein product [Diamesa tonsa]
MNVALVLLSICVVLGSLNALPAISNMKKFSPIASKPMSDIVFFKKQESKDGSYTFSYETTDGQKRNEIGTFVKSTKGDKELVLKVSGTYSYLNEDGARYTVDYTSGEEGYHAMKV